MAPVPSQFLAGRSLSSDNTIAIIFGIIGSVLAVLSVCIGWMMWKRTPAVNTAQRSQNEAPELELQRSQRTVAPLSTLDEAAIEDHDHHGVESSAIDLEPPLFRVSYQGPGDLTSNIFDEAHTDK